MSVEFIGYIGTREASEIRLPQGPVVNVAYVEQVARAHEEAGFDRALIAFHSNSPESILVASHAASVTKKLGFMVAHRPGFTAPTLAARQFATLDQFNGGRTAVHFITGGDDAELKQDGDYLTKDQRYERTSEYLDVVRKTWTQQEAFDYHGKYYNFDRVLSAVRTVSGQSLPVYFGGASDAAIEVAGKHADIYALWGETHAQVREITGRVNTSAARHGRTVRYSLSLRPIIAETEEKAWAKAEAILEKARELAPKSGFLRSATEPANSGSQRLLAAAAQGTRLDKRLWTGIAALTGAKGNSTALVGTPEQVADALLDYYDLGISTFLIRGFDPLADAIDYGRSLIPLTRELIARKRPAIAAAA